MSQGSVYHILASILVNVWVTVPDSVVILQAIRQGSATGRALIPRLLMLLSSESRVVEKALEKSIRQVVPTFVCATPSSVSCLAVQQPSLPAPVFPLST